MPLITVWPLSVSEVTRKEGSSSARRFSAAPIFSWSTLVLGSTATSITGLGNSIRSKTTWFEELQSVSPVVVSFKPQRASISPARASFTSSRLLACISNMRPTRSRLPLTEFMIVLPLSRVPEYTRTNVNDPTKGSVITLKARAENGSASSLLRIISASFAGFLPTMAARSVGAGR